MEYFDGIIIYCALSYLLLYLIYTNELDKTKYDWKDKTTLTLAPISIPVLILWAFINVITDI